MISIFEIREVNFRLNTHNEKFHLMALPRFPLFVVIKRKQSEEQEELINESLKLLE